MKTTKDLEAAHDPLVSVALRGAFYFGLYRKAIIVFMISCLINIIQGVTLVYIINNPQKPYYFATTLNGRIMPIFPLNEPNQSNESVINWVKQAATAAFTYNYSNYRQEFQAASGFFTGNGWNQFLEALKQSNNLEAVIQKKMLVSAKLTDKPSIIKEGRIQGFYAWRIKVPLLVTYQSTTTFSQQKVMGYVSVVRVSTLNSPSGIGIEQFVVGPAK